MRLRELEVRNLGSTRRAWRPPRQRELSGLVEPAVSDHSACAHHLHGRSLNAYSHSCHDVAIDTRHKQSAENSRLSRTYSGARREPALRFWGSKRTSFVSREKSVTIISRDMHARV